MRFRLSLLLAALVAVLPVAHAQRTSGSGRGGSSSSATASRQLCHITTISSHTGDTTATNLGGCTIPAGTLGNNSRVEVQIVTSGTTGNAANCSFSPRIGSTGAVGDAGFLSDAAEGAATTGQWKISINERNSASSQLVTGTQVRSSTFTNGGSSSLTLSIASQIFINLWGTNGNTTDTCNLQELDVVLWP